MRAALMDTVPGLFGAVIGGVIGYFAYEWGLRQGFVAGVVPGAFVGLGSGVLSSRRSLVRGIVCGIGALALGIFAEWKHWPFVVDESLGYFLAHLYQLKPLTMIMITLGTFLGFRWGGESFKPVPATVNANPTRVD
jgi:hypothetical protein